MGAQQAPKFGIHWVIVLNLGEQGIAKISLAMHIRFLLVSPYCVSHPDRIFSNMNLQATIKHLAVFVVSTKPIRK